MCESVMALLQQAISEATVHLGWWPTGKCKRPLKPSTNPFHLQVQLLHNTPQHRVHQPIIQDHRSILQLQMVQAESLVAMLQALALDLSVHFNMQKVRKAQLQGMSCSSKRGHSSLSTNLGTLFD